MLLSLHLLARDMKRHTISSVLLLLVMVSVYACNKAVPANPIITLQLRDSIYIKIGHPDSLKQAAMYAVRYNKEPYLLVWMVKSSRIVLVPINGTHKGKPIYIPALDSLCCNTRYRMSVTIKKTASLAMQGKKAANICLILMEI